MFYMCRRYIFAGPKSQPGLLVGVRKSICTALAQGKGMLVPLLQLDSIVRGVVVAGPECIYPVSLEAFVISQGNDLELLLVWDASALAYFMW